MRLYVIVTIVVALCTVLQVKGCMDCVAVGKEPVNTIGRVTCV